MFRMKKIVTAPYGMAECLHLVIAVKEKKNELLAIILALLTQDKGFWDNMTKSDTGKTCAILRGMTLNRFLIFDCRSVAVGDQGWLWYPAYSVRKPVSKTKPFSFAFCLTDQVFRISFVVMLSSIIF